MALKTFKIEILENGGSERLLAFYEAAGTAYRDHDRTKLIKSMESGGWSAVLAVCEGQDAGAMYLNWEPKYQPYRRLKLPEIQDLRVLETHRGHGAATAMINAAEGHAKKRGCPGVGISVGLHAGFGAAQRLYIKLGYMPDGQGVTYDREVVPEGAKRPVDDDLALMMLKYF